MRNKAFIAGTAMVVLGGLCASLASADFGRTMTKRERRMLESSGMSEEPRRSYAPSSAEASYAEIQNAFFNRDYAQVDRLSARYLADPAATQHRMDVLEFDGMSLMQLNRAMEARSKFRQMEAESRSLEDKARASTLVGDSYFFENDVKTAQDRYRETLSLYPQSAQANYLRQRLGGGLSGQPLRQREVEQSGFSGVQVGSFSKEKNAQSLLDKIQARHPDAVISKDPNRSVYRVRVGRFSSRQDAEVLRAKLQKEGYPTKIFS